MTALNTSGGRAALLMKTGNNCWLAEQKPDSRPFVNRALAGCLLCQQLKIAPAALYHGRDRPLVTLRQIANRSFVLLHDDLSAQKAADIVKRLLPERVIVQHRDHAAVYHHLYAREQFLDSLRLTALDQTLHDILHLEEEAATSTLDGGQDAETAPACCIVSDEGRVIGFSDATQLPATGNTRVARAGNGEPLIQVFSGTVRADFPERIPLGQVASLLISLATQARLGRSIPFSLPLGATVDIVVRAQRGFVLEGSGDGSLKVTGEDETLPIQFKLRATEMGPGQLRILCFYRGQPMGEVMLTPMVVVPATTTAGGHTATRQELSFPNTAQPDLTLLILEQKVRGETEIVLRVSAADTKFSLNLKPFGPIRLRVDPLEYFRTFFEDIEGLQVATEQQRMIAARRLSIKGARLLEDLLPEDLRVLLWALRNHVDTVQVLSDEPWIPWELLRLQGRRRGRVVEGPFLCESFAVTRWFPGIGRQLELHLRQIALVVPRDSRLQAAPEERAYLLSLGDNQRQVTEVEPHYLDVLEALSQGKYDGWHFTGHGHFEAPDPNRSAIRLEHGEMLRAEDIAGVVCNCGLAHPLVFLNACQTGREALSLTGVGGWARSFIEAGAAGFVGSLWSVYDKTASQFARALYGRLLAGMPLGKAAKEARATVRALGDPTWLAYSIYGDPTARVH